MPAVGISSACVSARSRFLGGLTRPEIEIILAAGLERRFPANSVITDQGVSASYFYLLTKGRARYSFTTQEGQKNLLYWLTPGETFGSAALLSIPSQYLVSTEAVRDSSVVEWDGATIRRMAMRYPRLLENALLISADYLGWYVATHAALTSQSARQRLAHILICLSEVLGQKVSGGIEFDVTNEELASAANITPFTASRLLSEWQRNRAIVKHRGKVVLRASERLFLQVV
jgi:CRP-like cAMP-binding protein